MNCHYCEKECLKVSNEFQRCLPCKTDYLNHGHIIHMYARINNKSYCLEFMNGVYEYPARIWDGIPTEYNNGAQIIVKLTTQPDITPKNICAKLKTILTFS